MKRNLIPPFALLALAALNASAAIYVPGLVQAKLPGDRNLTADIASHGTASFVPGTLATTIDEHGTRENPYDGVRWTWSNTNTFAYAGSMFLEAGTTYRFAKYVDDSGDVWVGGTKIIENGGCNDTPVGAYTSDSTGWHAIEARFGNGWSGAGSKGVANGFCWNTNGVDSFTTGTLTEAEGWHPVFDPGDASLLRAKLSDESHVAVTAIGKDGDDLLVSVAFADVPMAGASLAAFWGPADGDDTAAFWEHAADAVATGIAAGASPAAPVRIAGAADAAYVAFRLSGTMPPAMPYADWTPTFALAGAEPVLSLASSVVAYTNIGYIVSATALGAGASSVGAVFEVATDASFASVVTNVPLSFASLGGASVPVVGLATNTAHWARVTGTNSAGVAADPVVLGPLTTLAPGTPVVSIKKLYEGFSHTTWTVTLSELGVGAKDASIWLDLSAKGDFTDALPFGGSVTDGVPATVTIDAPGLAHGTTYAVRGRAVNDWGVAGVSAADEAVIREEPVEMREPGFETGAAPGEMVLSIEADDVEPGATYSVALAIDGSTVRTWTGLSEPGVVSLSWTGTPGRTHEGVFTVVSALGGITWTRRYPFSFVIGARNIALSTSSSIAGQIFRVGDRATIADATAAAVLGDGVATLDGQTVSMVHPGFTLLRDVEGGEHWFAVYETPGGDGDVFLFDWTANSDYGWTSAPWTKVTANTGRTVPDHADDVAMVRVARSDYGFFTLPAAGVTLGQLVVGMTANWTLDHADGTTSPLRFSRTDGGTPAFLLSRPDPTSTGELQLRLGNYDRNGGGDVVGLSFDGPEMAVDFCGDSPASKAYARKGFLHFAIANARFDLQEGQTLRIRNGSRTTSDGTDFAGIRGWTGSGYHGPGTLEIDGANFSCQHSSPDAFVDVGRFRVVTGRGPFDAENNVSRFTARFNTIPSVPIEILSGRCPTNLNAQTTLVNYWSVGVSNAWLSPSVLLSGCNYQIEQNGAYAPGWDFWDATNVSEKATIRGHVGLYGPPSYGRDNHVNAEGVQQGRVTHHVRFKDLELFDRWSTMQANGLNFNRVKGSNNNTNDIQGTLRIDNWEEHVRRPPGVDPSDYDGTVYAIVPWMTVHCNDNNQGLADADWGQEQTFPGVRETDGCVRLLQSLNNNGSQTLKDRGPNDNFYFSSKPGFWLENADRTLFSLVYSTQELPHYAADGNFYLDSSKGGHKLTIASGAMAVIRQNKWLGQPADMTRNGRIVLQGDPSYLHVPSPGVSVPASGSASGGEDYNMCWVPLVAEKDLAKGGAGSIGLAGDQREIHGTLAVNGGELWLGYPAYKKHGYLYTYGSPERGWPMHGCATDCDFVVRGGAVLSLASNGYRGVDSDGAEVDEPVIAWGKEHRHTIALERSGNAVGGVYVAEGVEGIVYEATFEDVDGAVGWFERGTWGSSESPAQHVDDVHFAGPGVLKVQHDRRVRPTILILR